MENKGKPSNSGSKFNSKTNLKEKELQNKTAVALGYDTKDSAPRIIASGKGYLADKILQGAKENKIPVHEDSRLAASLSKLDLGDYIPPELYEVVSEIMIFVDDMDRIKSKLIK